MKRIFAHIGAASIITLLVLCLSSIKIVICFTVGLAVLFIASLCLRYFRENITVPLCLGTALFSCVVFLLCMNFVVAPQLDLSGSEGDISFYIIEQDGINADGDYIYVAKTTTISNSPDKRIKIRLKSSAPIKADYYTVVNARAIFYAIADSPFSSYGYWADDIYLTAVCDRIEPTNEKISSPMLAILHLRDEIKYAFNVAISDDEGALATALVTGDKSGIDDIVKSYFRFAGASHIMAISGLHLVVVAGSIWLLLQKIRVPNYVVSPVVLATILFYCALAGFSRSIVRAGIMMAVMVAAPLFRSHADTLNSLGFATFLICLNPFAVTDIGMLLSVLSTLSLILASGISNSNAIMDDKLSKKIAVRVSNRMTTVYMTVFVILFTLPVLYFAFGSVSIGSLVSNIIVVPVGSVTVIMSVLTFVLYKVGINIVTAVVATATKYVLHFITIVVRWISSYSGAMISLDKYFGMIIAGTLVIIAVCFISKNSVLLKRGMAIALSFVVVATGIVAFLTKDYSYLYVTPNGAIVVDTDDRIIVAGVNDYGDFCGVSSFLTSRNETIDLLVANGDDEYSAKLTEVVPTNVVLTDELSDYMLNIGHYNELVLQNEYTVSLDSATLDFHYGDMVISVDDISIALTNKTFVTADIVVDYKKDLITDNYGRIALDDNDIIYTIRDNSFSARRMN